MNATKLLEDWTRKGYFCKVEFYGGYYPGDGFQVELWNDIRRVTVPDYEHPAYEAEGYVSLDDLILFALERWESDPSEKFYEVLFVPQWGRNDQEDERLIAWSVWHKERLQAKVKAKNDQEVSEIICKTFGSKSRVLVCKERSEKLTAKES